MDRPPARSRPVTGPADRASFTYSIVVPVFNSEGMVGATVDRIVEVFEEAGLSYELILVNDGSRDGSWDVIAETARTRPARRRAQPAAELRPAPRQPGRAARVDRRLRHHHGRRPAEPAGPGAAAHRRGDERLGRRLRPFERKQAAGYRRLGSKLISMINRRVFAPARRPRGLELPHPAPRRRRPDLRLAHRPPVHHRPGADVLQQPHRRRWCATSRARSARATTACARILRLVLRSCSATRCSRCGWRRWPASWWRW